MDTFKKQGKEIRNQARLLVLEFMTSQSDCGISGQGMKQAEIFRGCGFDWGNREKATSSNQQYWIVALLRELEAENKVEQVRLSGPWRIRKGC